MLTANSAAILTDAFPADQRGLALGINQVAAIAGQFIGLVAGGILAEIDWRAVFWVNVPVGVFGTIWAYHKLRDTGERHPGRIDWWGNITFAVGLSAILIGVTNGIKPYGGHAMGWTNPTVIGSIVGGLALLVAFVVIEKRVAEPMFQLGLFRIRAFAAGSAAGLIAATARGGLQFMLIIWLQGIWLPLHGYSYTETPLWAGIYLLPLTAAFLISGPVCGYLSDRFGARGFATAGMLVFAASFVGLMLLPVDFSYWAFALLITLNGIGVGMFSSPNGVVDMLGEPDDLLSRAADAIAIVRRAGGVVGYVRVAFEDADLEAFPPTSGMGQRIRTSPQALHNDSPSTAVHDRVAPEPGDILVRKVRVGAFSTTDLDAQLRERGIDTLILAGISTSGVVLSTVRDASDRDYRVLVLADATADPQPDLHEFLTERIFPGRPT